LLKRAKMSRIVVTEKDFREQVRDLCRIYGWKIYFSWSSLHSPKGFPDLILVRDNIIMAVELKSEKGRTTVEQDEWLAAFSAAGVKSCVWRPHDIDNIAKCLSYDETFASEIPGLR